MGGLLFDSRWQCPDAQELDTSQQTIYWYIEAVPHPSCILHQCLRLLTGRRC